MHQVIRSPAGSYGAVPTAVAHPSVTPVNDVEICTTYDYDRRGLLTKITYPEAGGRSEQQRRYNVAGWLADEWDETNYPCACISRTTTMTWGSRPPTRPIRMPSAPSMPSYTYDALGCLQTIDAGRTGNAVPMPTVTASFNYDPAGNRTDMTDDSGTTTHIYDGLGRPTQVGGGLPAMSTMITTTWAGGPGCVPARAGRNCATTTLPEGHFSGISIAAPARSTRFTPRPAMTTGAGWKRSRASPR